MKKINLNPLILLVLFIVYITGNLFFFIISFLCLCLHELVHLFFLCKNRIIIDNISIEPFGISIKTNNPKIILPSVFLSAPLFNLIIAFMLYIITRQYYSDILNYFFIKCLIFLGIKVITRPIL